MKSATAYYCMLLYITVMLRPLLPFIEDNFSHIFSETIHIATVHAVYGNNHLEKELAITSENTNGKHHTATTFEEQVSLHLSATENTYHADSSLSSNTYFILKLSKLKTGFIINFSPPPEFS